MKDKKYSILKYVFISLIFSILLLIAADAGIGIYKYNQETKGKVQKNIENGIFLDGLDEQMEYILDITKEYKLTEVSTNITRCIYKYLFKLEMSVSKLEKIH